MYDIFKPFKTFEVETIRFKPYIDKMTLTVRQTFLYDKCRVVTDTHLSITWRNSCKINNWVRVLHLKLWVFYIPFMLTLKPLIGETASMSSFESSGYLFSSGA